MICWFGVLRGERREGEKERERKEVGAKRETRDEERNESGDERGDERRDKRRDKRRDERVHEGHIDFGSQGGARTSGDGELDVGLAVLDGLVLTVQAVGVPARGTAINDLARKQFACMHSPA